MFQYVYPQFEKKRLLRVEMLDQLRDYPKDYLQLSYQGYSDGIVSGCKVSWDEGRLTLLPGIVWKGGNLYFMKEPYTVDCQAENQVRYLLESGKFSIMSGRTFQKKISKKSKKRLTPHRKCAAALTSDVF